MRGQYIAINELLLFGMGALLALAVIGIISFTVTSLQKQTERDQYYMIANLVSMATTKTYLCSNIKNVDCNLIVEIPRRLSEERYIISLSNNISVSNFRTNERIEIKPPKLHKTIKGEATSSTRYFVLESRGENITLSRG